MTRPRMCKECNESPRQKGTTVCEPCWDRHIKRIVDAAPPLTLDQRLKLSGLLRGAREQREHIPTIADELGMGDDL